MIYLAWFASAATALLAFLHLIWSLGFHWPALDEAELARAVIGTRGITRMPHAFPLALYVPLYMAAALWPIWPSGELHAPGLLAFALVFLMRGAATYLGLMRRLCPEPDFNWFDSRVYAPLHLALGAAFAALWLAS